MTSAATYQFWEHGQSGEVFAIRLDGSGRITGLRGPLFSNQMLSNQLPVYRYDDDPEDLAWLEARRENWVPFEY